MKQLLRTSFAVSLLSICATTPVWGGKITSLFDAKTDTEIVAFARQASKVRTVAPTSNNMALRARVSRAWGLCSGAVVKANLRIQAGLTWFETEAPKITQAVIDLNQFAEKFLLIGAGTLQMLGYAKDAHMLTQAANTLERVDQKALTYINATLLGLQFISSYLATTPEEFKDQISALGKLLLDEAASHDNDTVVYVDKTTPTVDIVIHLGRTANGNPIEVRFHPSTTLVYNKTQEPNAPDPQALADATHMLCYFQAQTLPGISMLDKTIVNQVYTTMVSHMGGLVDAQKDNGVFDIYFGDHITSKENPAVSFKLLPLPSSDSGLGHAPSMVSVGTPCDSVVPIPNLITSFGGDVLEPPHPAPIGSESYQTSMPSSETAEHVSSMSEPGAPLETDSSSRQPIAESAV